MEEINNKINILGTDYTIGIYKDNSKFPENTCGLCDMSSKRISILKTNINDCDIPRRIDEEILRHEIIHAFLNESGLSSSSIDSWATNEEMVDWIAKQVHKIVESIIKGERILHNLQVIE